jgi:hypothetical protein
MIWPFKRKFPICAKNAEQNLIKQLVFIARGEISYISSLNSKTIKTISPSVVSCINQKADVIKVYLLTKDIVTLNGQMIDISYLKDKLNDVPNDWTILIWKGGFAILPPKWSNRFIKEIEV